MPTPTEHSLNYGTTTIEFTLVYMDCKSLAIHVHPDTRVMVEAPIGSEFGEIEQRVQKRAAWILKQQRNFKRYSIELLPRQYVSGETHRYLGRQYQLKIVPSPTQPENVKMDRGRIIIHVQDTKSKAPKQKLLEDWYRGHAQRVFTERVDIWWPRFERYGIVLPQVVVRRMKSRWGSCTPEGKITLNLKLIQVPKTLIDYVIVHELSHLVEHNHGADFYTLKKRIMPDWEERKERLNTFEF